MGYIKLLLKSFFYHTRTAHLLDKAVFAVAYLKNRRQNIRFKRSHNDIALPPDYYLYETYQLNYAHYIRDGVETAGEIREWTNAHLPFEPGKVLEWGCGVARIIRHLPRLYGSKTMVYGCDINKEMIEWGKRHIKDVHFSVIDYNPPTTYQPGCFDMVYAISVFTHINVTLQDAWLQEIHRILTPQGVFLFTTHGNAFFHQLLPGERIHLEKNGAFTRSYYKKGHRMMSSYNVPEKFTLLVKKYFDVLEFWDGDQQSTKVGGQDLWIVRKKKRLDA